jgi:hypothetical protein
MITFLTKLSYPEVKQVRGWGRVSGRGCAGRAAPYASYVGSTATLLEDEFFHEAGADREAQKIKHRLLLTMTARDPVDHGGS